MCTHQQRLFIARSSQPVACVYVTAQSPALCLPCLLTLFIIHAQVYCILSLITLVPCCYEVYEYVVQCVHCRLRFFSSIKYNIGGLEFSANDMEHGVLRANRPSPANPFVLIGKPQWAPGYFRHDDPRLKQVARFCWLVHVVYAEAAGDAASAVWNKRWPLPVLRTAVIVVNTPSSCTYYAVIAPAMCDFTV